MSTEQHIGQIRGLVEEAIAEKPALFLVDVRIKPTNNIKVFVDGDEGVSIESCVAINRKLYKRIEELGMYPAGDFSLEVSSPGLDRVLRRDKDYVRYAGRLVDIKFYRPREGIKAVTATLRGMRDGVLLVEQQGKEIAYPQEEIAQVRLHIDMGKSKK